MASQINKTMLWMLLVFLLLSSMQQHYSCNAFGNPQVPCLFVFGDSLSDNGNNNNLFTLAKTNYPPYGIDFPMGPTGRFTNGRNVIDILAQLLGFDDYIPPFANAKGEEILKGVNYASGGGGIRNESAQEQGDRISMDQQLQNHQITVLEMNRMLGNHNKSAAEHLSKCIYVVAIGSNDYINNYFMPQYFLTSRIYTPQQYAVVLNHQLSQQLTTLYKNGARKFAVYGLGVLGSAPYERNSCGSGTNVSACVDNINNAAELFNDRLKSLVAQLNQNLINATFIFINSTGIASSSSSMASMVADVPCCKVSSVTGLCVPFGNPCSNRSQYLFWDAFHPTEILYELYARRGYKAESPSDAYPFDITHLALL